MKRIIDNLESLEVVRGKCKSRNVDFKGEELRHLNVVFMELQKSYGNKFVRPLDQSCSSCIVSAMNAIHNYIVNEEPKVEEKPKERYKSLKQLRILHPHIKATSVNKFMELLNQQ